MAARHDVGGAVLRREGIHRHDRRQRHHRARSWDGVEGVVGVKRLRRLVRLDPDRLAGGEQIAGQQIVIAERQHPGIQRDLPEHAAARDQRVDALGAEALEVVPPAVRPEIEAEHATHFGQRGRIEEIGDDRVPLGVDACDVCRDLHDDSVSWQRAWHDSRRAPGRTLTDGPPAEKEGVLVDSLAYASAPVTVRRDLVDAQIRAWRGLGRPGTWWTGAERVAIAAEVRAAARCALCLARKAALSPYTVAGIHDGPAELPPVVIEAVHRIATDPGRLTRQWFVRLLDGGLGDAAYVELLGVLVTVLGIDAFCRAIGVPPHPLPHAEPGTPARARPAKRIDAEHRHQ